MKNTVLIIGGFKLPQGSASAVRALGNARLLSELGYDVVLVGKIGDRKENQLWYEFDGFKCFDIECVSDKYGFTINFMDKLVEKLPAKDIYAMVVYNFPGIALNRLRKFSVRNGMSIISDTTEWYAIEGKNPIMAAIRGFQTEYRMRYVNRKIGNLICSTYYIADYYRKCRSVIIPMIDDESFTEKIRTFKHSKPGAVRRFIYAGSPGYKFKKDKIDVIIKCFERLKEENIPFEFDVYGISEEQYSHVFGTPDFDDSRYIVRFHGRVPREEIQKALETTDFYVLFRPDDKVCRVGFSTKAMEATASAVPLIANDVNGDFARYFTNNQALICGAKDTEKFYELLKIAANMESDKVNEMKESCIKHNPFDYRCFIESTGAFMKEVGKNEK